MIRGRRINLPYIMMNIIITVHNQKQKSLPYGQCLTIVFEYFDILLTNTDKNPYSKAMEIDTMTLNKMGYVLTNDGAWMSKDQIGAHVEEEHVEEEKQNIGGDAEFVDMFETSPRASSSKDVGTSSWQSRMEVRLEHIEGGMHHIREGVHDMKDMMASFLTTLNDYTTII
jgi:hypothetical protein